MVRKDIKVGSFMMSKGLVFELSFRVKDDGTYKVRAWLKQCFCWKKRGRSINIKGDLL